MVVSTNCKSSFTPGDGTTYGRQCEGLVKEEKAWEMSDKGIKVGGSSSMMM